MEATGIGTAIMLVIAAALWFLYLVPTWLRRREYLATERTATRLQQTLRVMAETSETPEILRVEATMRDAARRQRVLRARERADRRRLAQQLRREKAAARAEDRAAVRTAPSSRDADAGALRRRRVRHGRGLASMLLISATAVAVVQGVLIATTGAVPGSWLVLVVAGAGGCGGVALQRRLDAVTVSNAAARRASAPAIPAAAPLPAAPAAPSREWTPVPLPRPRYLDRPAPQPVVPTADAGALLRAEAEEAERARIAAHAEPEVVPFRPRAVPAAAAAHDRVAVSRFARMGLVDPRDTAAPDLDEVLRRRRSAG